MKSYKIRTYLNTEPRKVDTTQYNVTEMNRGYTADFQFDVTDFAWAADTDVKQISFLFKQRRTVKRFNMFSDTNAEPILDTIDSIVAENPSRIIDSHFIGTTAIDGKYVISLKLNGDDTAAFAASDINPVKYEIAVLLDVDDQVGVGETTLLYTQLPVLVNETILGDIQE